MTSFLQDVKYSLRVLTKSPSFTAVAILSLALGIGANTTIFTLVNAVLLAPLPVDRPGELMAVYTTDAKNTGAFQNFLQVSYPNFKDYRDQNSVFSGVAAHQILPFSVTMGSGSGERVFGEIVSGNYFSLLGVKPARGRFFLPEEDRTPGLHPVVVLSDGFWKRRFAQDPGMVGRTIQIAGSGFTVIGIAPEGFQGLTVLPTAELWVPTMMYRQVLSGIFREWPESRRALLFNMVGRLKPDVGPDQAAVAMKTLARQLELEYPRENEKRSVTLVPTTQAIIDPNIRGQALLAGGMLMTVVVLVLLIACANIANLQLARASGRKREVAVRLSLGAGRGRLVRQLLTESVILALIGGAAGLLLGMWGRDLLWSFRPAFLPAHAMDLSLDMRVLGFVFLLSVVTGIVFGLVPALQASQSNLSIELKDRSVQIQRSNRLFTLRNSLVMAEVALSVISLVGAGLFLRSLRNAQQIDPGSPASGLVVLSVDVGAQGYEEARAREFYRQMVERAGAVPGVKSATLASNVPLFGGGLARSVFPEGLEGDPERSGILVQLDTIDLGYFETLGIRISAGRDFNPSDTEHGLRTAIINETGARQFWPGKNPIGQRFTFFGDQFMHEVVGVARDIKYNTIGEDPQPYMYLPLKQSFAPGVSLLVRAESDPATVLGTLQREIQTLDRELPILNPLTMEQVVGQSLFAARMGAVLLGTFGFLALALAAVGIYGVLAYSVSQRTQEIGVRMALGASPGDVLTLVLRQSMALVALGAAVGLAVAGLLARSLDSLLFGIGTTDPTTFAGAGVLLASVALLASYVPARRATRVDPLLALRYE